MTLKREIKDAYIEGGASIYVKTHSNAVYVDENETETLTKRLDNVKDSITKHTSQLDTIVNTIGYVTYEMFGAKGDGVTDDGEAIKNAHIFANTHNKNIKCPNVKTYYVKDVEGIQITTNVDWGNCTFIIDDNTSNTSLFTVVSNDSPITLSKEQLLGVKADKSTTKLEVLANRGECFVKLFNNNKKVYIREGLNANDGSDLMDMTVVNNVGELMYKLNWEFEEITSCVLYPIPSNYLTVCNGNFLTIADDKQEDTYISRGITIRRNKTIVDNITHKVQEGGTVGRPSSGFIHFLDCCYLIFTNSTLTPRLYRNNVADTVSLGTYDLGVTNVINLTLDNIHAFSMDSKCWGVWGGNCAKHLNINNCELNRIDSHKGSFNITIKNTKIGVHGLTLIGGGDLVIENVETHSIDLVSLRQDYGGHWEGDIYIKNITHHVYDTRKHCIVSGYNKVSHNYGYVCCCANSIQVENYHVISHNNKFYFSVVMSSTSKEGNILNKYKLPSNIQLKNITFDSPLIGVSDILAVNLEYCDMPNKAICNTEDVNGIPHTRKLNIHENCVITVDNVQFYRHNFDHGNNNLIYNIGNKGLLGTDDYTDSPYNCIPKFIIRNCTIQIYLGGLPGILDISKSTILHLICKNGGTRSKCIIDNCDFKPYRSDTSSYTSFSIRVNEAETFINNCRFYYDYDETKVIPDFNTLRNVYEIFQYDPASNMVASNAIIKNSKFDYTLYNTLLSLEPTFMAKFPTLPMCEFGVNQFPKSGDTDTRKSLTNSVPNFYEFWDTTINKKCICFNKTWLDTNGNLIP